MAIDDELQEVFRAEVDEAIAALQEALDGAPDSWDIDVLFRRSHNIKGSARMVGVAGVRDAAHALEDLFSLLRDGAELDHALSQLAREGIKLLMQTFESLDGDFSGSIAAYRDKLAALAPELAATGESSRPDEPTSTTADVSAAEGRGNESRDGTLRVSTRKTERVLGIGSDLVLLSNTLAEHVGAAREAAELLETLVSDHPDLATDSKLRALTGRLKILRVAVGASAAESGKLSRELQDAGRELRMVRIDSLKSFLARVVRDACETVGKSARFEIVGGGTEIDRGLLDELRDPLLHLLRNAVAHGIESPKVRKKAKKDERGSVQLRASLHGERVEIIVADDGGGIDVEAIRERALGTERLSLEAAERATVDELYDLLFEPGFSSRDASDALSGRGVGLDVVRNNLRSLDGRISVISEPGYGTRFELRVPVTRLTTTGVVVRVGEEHYVAPTRNVVRTAQIDLSTLGEVDGQKVVDLDGATLAVSHLDALMATPGESGQMRPAVVLAAGDGERVLTVDEVLGEREIVVQALPWNLGRISWFSGCTVGGGGHVWPVLDARSIVDDGAAADGERLEKTPEGEGRKRVLVVDDSVTSRTLERNILASAGFDVAVATDGDEALRWLANNHVDVVVSDVEMPVMDGFELTRQLRADERWRYLPVILVTSLADESHRAAGADAGADAYIVKGQFDHDDLLDAVRRYLS